MVSTDTAEQTENTQSELTQTGTPADYEYYKSVLADQEFPCAFVDRDRLSSNADSIEDRADGTQVRIASKSIRSRAVLDRILDESDCFDGIMCYSGREAAYLAAYGFEDLLVAYPVYQKSEIAGVRDANEAGATVTVMVDSEDHVKRLSDFGEAFGTSFELCIDIDLSTKHFGMHFGVYRSGIRDAEAALSLCETIDTLPSVTLSGMMGYEAQLAGIPDRSPANGRVKNAVLRALKRRSRQLVRRRRVDIVEAVVDAGYDLQFVNGGGTGTIEFTTQDPTVTEITVGSGFYFPALFDYYDRFEHKPAAGFAVAVARNPDSGIYTCRGGGYIASGPPDVGRQPAPWFPEGVELRNSEGAGEVQTPVLYDGTLSPGDPVFFRHAKAGELCEQFESLHVLSEGEIVKTVPTYRGDGRCFL
ncbi:alanine racemase [Halovenus rubra]|uniref:Alanine racemase n=2 Tax=Halovenus rubra TaxID=869890 RepID=A0ACC7E3A6_9EURY|nr:alanine racemase [Halovenus rubra]